MLPVIVIVGRPNVGKSTLFNVLTRSRAALVADTPGLTRDRQYGLGHIGERSCIVVDTGGLHAGQGELDALMTRQAWRAIEEASAILFLVDAREGLTATDEEIAGALRRSGKPLFLVANKCDGVNEHAIAEFHRLGIGAPHAIAAAHGRGVPALMATVLAALPEPPAAPGEAEADADTDAPVRVAVIGRPNVGKSTLVNRLLGEERVLAFDAPGTTRDAIEIPFEREGRAYLLVDTAGLRRRARMNDDLERLSAIKSLEALERAQVVILLLDAQSGIGEQDQHLIGHVADSGRALVVAINKWDGLPADQRATVKRELDRKLAFLDFAEQHFISALHGSGVGVLWDAVNRAFRSATVKLSTPQLTRALQQAVSEYPPPLVRGRRIKLRYAHQGGQNPPVVVIHGNQTEAVPPSYTRYLTHALRRIWRLTGTPLRIEYKGSANPYEGRKNPLTPRQRKQRERLMRHVRGRG
jgi:GTP-binding protein